MEYQLLSHLELLPCGSCSALLKSPNNERVVVQGCLGVGSVSMVQQ